VTWVNSLSFLKQFSDVCYKEFINLENIVFIVRKGHGHLCTKNIIFVNIVHISTVHVDCSHLYFLGFLVKCIITGWGKVTSDDSMLIVTWSFTFRLLLCRDDCIYWCIFLWCWTHFTVHFSSSLKFSLRQHAVHLSRLQACLLLCVFNWMLYSSLRVGYWSLVQRASTTKCHCSVKGSNTVAHMYCGHYSNTAVILF